MNSRATVRCIHFPSLSTSVQFADRTRCARTRTHTHIHTNTLRTLILSLARLPPPPSAPSPVFRDRQAGSSGPASLLSCHSHRAHAHARSHAAPCHAVPCFTMLCLLRLAVHAIPHKPWIPRVHRFPLPRHSVPSVSSYHEVGLPDIPPSTPKVSQGYYPTRRNLMPCQPNKAVGSANHAFGLLYGLQ